MNTRELVKWIEHLNSINRMDIFYNSKYFKRLKREVHREQHNECQRCKEIGKLTIVRAKERFKRTGVCHHVKEVKEYPELALSKYYIDEEGNKQRQLIVLCNECHEIEHNRFSPIPKKEQLNEERW